MGGCFSGDVRGGKEAVGGGGSGMGRGPAAAGHGGANEAVDHFFQGHGLRGLYTPLEVSNQAHSSPVQSTGENPSRSQFVDAFRSRVAIGAGFRRGNCWGSSPSLSLPGDVDLGGLSLSA
jgi:hypothetical protein